MTSVAQQQRHPFIADFN